ncbi:MAG TPA: dihydrolipoamide acetyltransferase family protein [Streptosporangiaceae bacterium]|nr:dihydrolipoamide acetyltransferase family protein [Streptosporangiaceae bacterium]
MADVKQFKLPDVGEGLTEADIVSWKVKPGDQVTVNQVIVEIETAKSLVELPCPWDGVVTDLLVPEGQSVDVGTPIIAVDVSADAGAGSSAGGEGAALAEVNDPAAGSQATEDLVPSPPADETAREPGIEGSPAPKIERQAVLVGYGVKLGTTARRPRKGGKEGGGSGAGPAPQEPAVPLAPSGNGASGRTGTVDRPLAKPPVRKLAKDLGVDLAALTGSGPEGTITREDVQAAAAGPVAEAPAAMSVPMVPAGGEERIPVRGVRKHTALAVTSSAFTAPHVTEFLQVDVTETMAAVQRLRELPEFEGWRPSPLLLVAKALMLAVARHPMINSSWDEEAQEIVVKHYVNLGIAAATNRGLLVPNIKNAHTLSLPGLARALAELASTAREGKTPPADLARGTITITNVGVFGVDTGTPILTPGESAILALGQVKQAPWVHEGELAVRQVTTLALSFDHRIVDGDLGSTVLRDIGAMLTDPIRMIAWT